MPVRRTVTYSGGGAAHRQFLLSQWRYAMHLKCHKNTTLLRARCVSEAPIAPECICDRGSTPSSPGEAYDASQDTLASRMTPFTVPYFLSVSADIVCLCVRWQDSDWSRNTPASTQSWTSSDCHIPRLSRHHCHYQSHCSSVAQCLCVTNCA